MEGEKGLGDWWGSVTEISMKERVYAIVFFCFFFFLIGSVVN